MKLESFFDNEDSTEEGVMGNDEAWQDEWVGMPEFNQEDNDCHQKINVRFDDQASVDEFAKLLGQKITPKTKSIWFPALDRGINSCLLFIDDES